MVIEGLVSKDIIEGRAADHLTRTRLSFAHEDNDEILVHPHTPESLDTRNVDFLELERLRLEFELKKEELKIKAENEKEALKVPKLYSKAISKDNLIEAQTTDRSLAKFRRIAQEDKAINKTACFYVHEDFWRSYNIKHATHNINKLWKKVTQSCMYAVWRNVWPERMPNLSGFTKVVAVHSDITNISQEDNFQEVDEENVAEVLESHSEELSRGPAAPETAAKNEKSTGEENLAPRMLTLKVLSTAMGHVNIAMELLAENAPNSNRCLSVRAVVQKGMLCYKELYLKKKKEAHCCTRQQSPPFSNSTTVRATTLDFCHLSSPTQELHLL
ncbi:Tigger transposable element-derived protein 1-like 122 [Homarus americanus]|uniref:Tigger transposable element-derived protein 1-like 122 n=1 Tax=Homarus americanus TaxID=6706 RepID=A0A8J5JGK3_HOMAM|nr:Tigger transposable element-derived protein 1-like 122 [Homarus americanus]